jgi:glycosyltransferase involved in cell wall biosynthesis
MTPRVTFVVPCYNLAHLLGECVGSILAQSYQDLEVLIMDDCSPDATAEIARGFDDPRVRHVRHDANVGHLRNYNAGIGLARGEYIWLISADDRLRRPYVVERFVDHLDHHDNVGYVFCPVVRFDHERETTVYGSHGSRNEIFRGREFLRTLASGNSVPAASGLARKTCYDRYGMFPLDLPFAGDWYLWSLFALHTDVGYLAEPMVGWRTHSANMTHSFNRRPWALIHDEIIVLVRMREHAREAGDTGLVRLYTDAIASYYAWRLAAGAAPDLVCHMTAAEMDSSLDEWCTDASERVRIQCDAYAALGDACYDAGDVLEARHWYAMALRRGRRMRTAAKYLLLRAGRVGGHVRTVLARS